MEIPKDDPFRSYNTPPTKNLLPKKPASSPQSPVAPLSNPTNLTHPLPPKPINSFSSTRNSFSPSPNRSISDGVGLPTRANSTATFANPLNNSPSKIDQLHLSTTMKITKGKSKGKDKSKGKSHEESTPKSNVTNADNVANTKSAAFSLIVEQLDLMEMKNILKAEARRILAFGGSVTENDAKIILAKFYKDIDDRDMNDLRNMLKAEQLRMDRDQLAKSVQRYFDVSRKNTTVVSLDQFRLMLHTSRNLGRTYAGDPEFSSALRSALNYVNHRSLPETKANALKALREVGRDDVRGDDQRGHVEDVLEAMKLVILCMPKQQRKNYVSRYGSFKALSNFWIDLPCEDEAESWLDEPKHKWVKDRGQRLDDSMLMEAPVADRISLSFDLNNDDFGKGGLEGIFKPDSQADSLYTRSGDTFKNLMFGPTTGLKSPEDLLRDLNKGDLPSRYAGFDFEDHKIDMKSKTAEEVADELAMADFNKLFGGFGGFKADDHEKVDRKGRTGGDDGWGWNRLQSKKEAFKEVYGITYQVDGIKDKI